MNKYITIVIVLVILVAGGIGYREFIASPESSGIETGVVKEITITARKATWSFEPSEIHLTQGDRVKLTVINEDEYDHGFAIDAFGVSQRLPGRATIQTEFVVTQPGEFPYYCSVPCGDGEVAGVKRGHFDQVGKLVVEALVTKN